MQSEASQQLSTHSNKTGSDQTTISQVQSSPYDPISAGSSRRSSESGEPALNGLTTHLHRMHARAQASQHLKNTSNLVVLSQNDSLASDSESLQHNFRSGLPATMPPPAAVKIGQQSTNQSQPLSTLNSKPHHPNQDVVLGQLDENKPIEENKDIILPDEMVNYLNELAEQNNRPPSVISDAVTSVSRYVPPNVNMHNQTKNTACTDHSQNCAQNTSQNWPCSCCQNSHNSCAVQSSCAHNHSNFSSANHQNMENCCYPNKTVQQQQMQNCYNEMAKPALTNPPCGNNNPATNLQRVPYNQSVPYSNNFPAPNPPVDNSAQNSSYQTYNYPQQGMNMGYSEPQHFNSGNSMHAESVASYPKSDYISNNCNHPNNYMHSRPNGGNPPMQYADNQQNLYPSQTGMQANPNAFNSAAMPHQGSCSQSTYSSHNLMDKPTHSPGHMHQNMHLNSGHTNHGSGAAAANHNPVMNHSNLGINHNNLGINPNLALTQNNLPVNQNNPVLNSNNLAVNHLAMNPNNQTMNQSNVNMNHNLTPVNHIIPSANNCNSVTGNQNQQMPMHHNHQMPFKPTMNMNHNLQVMPSNCANQHQNYLPQNSNSYNTNTQQWCHNHSQNYNYNQNCNLIGYSQETASTVSQNRMMHPNQIPQGFNNNTMPHQPCMHKMTMNKPCVSACNYNNQMVPNRNDSMQYQMQQQTPAPMQYPVIQSNQYQDPKFMNCEPQAPINGTIQQTMETTNQNQLPSELLLGDGRCCNHRLGTSIQAQHSASSVGEQDERESSVSAVARSSHTCSTSDQREIQCQNVSQSSLSGEAYQRTLKYVQQCQEFINQQQPSPGCNRVSSSTDRQSPSESHSPLLQTSNMVINDLNSGLHSLVEEETRYLQLLH